MGRPGPGGRQCSAGAVTEDVEGVAGPCAAEEKLEGHADSPEFAEVVGVAAQGRKVLNFSPGAPASREL